MSIREHVKEAIVTIAKWLETDGNVDMSKSPPTVLSLLDNLGKKQ